jgi:hypothetical protein
MLTDVYLFDVFCAVDYYLILGPLDMYRFLMDPTSMLIMDLRYTFDVSWTDMRHDR